MEQLQRSNDILEQSVSSLHDIINKMSEGKLMKFYFKPIIPDNYSCDECGIGECKLWRLYNCFMDEQKLFCANCAAEYSKEDISDIDEDGRHSNKDPLGYEFKSDSIGWLVPAVPTDNDNYWGYTSVPQEGVMWWKNIPTFSKED